MAGKHEPAGNLVHVEIFGQSYAVRAGAEPGYVEQLAAHVDAQMREVSRSAGAIDTVRAAVLAALNIADECFRLRAATKEADQRVRERAQALASELAALEE
jgi:cell division protein ZapA